MDLTVQAPTPQWLPDRAAPSRISEFAASVGLADVSYRELHAWSVNDLSAFWSALWRYFDLPGTPTALPGALHETTDIASARWFPGTTINYAERVLAARGSILALGERDRSEYSCDRIEREVKAVAALMQDHGVGKGDVVAAYAPNVPEAIIAMIATASIGAIWAACGADYSVEAAIERLAQLKPKALFAADGYILGGTARDVSEAACRLRDALAPTIAVAIQRIGTGIDGFLHWPRDGAPTGVWPEPVPFDHPLWVVFSSGTTGKPKGIVHSHGGIVVEHLKTLGLHFDLRADDTFFWFTSPSWMMWNLQASGLLLGSRIVTYDGRPSSPELFHMAAEQSVTVLGTSPGYVLACIKAGVTPRRGDLRIIGVTGSVLPAESSSWLGQLDVPIASISGGTDVASAFVGWSPWNIVWPGELSAPLLGVSLCALSTDGRPLIGEVGELVIDGPMPSMPIAFWDDDDGSRLHAAYFSQYPGLWRHGDWATLTDRNSVLIHGRSDATLNRNGVRLGSAEIYRVVDGLPEVSDSVILGIETPDGAYWMPLFVTLTDGVELDDGLRDRIAHEIRSRVSPRHVPDDIITAPAIPYTRTGKKVEVPLKSLFQGRKGAQTVATNALTSPEAYEWFERFANKWLVDRTIPRTS